MGGGYFVTGIKQVLYYRLVSPFFCPPAGD